MKASRSKNDASTPGEFSLSGQARLKLVIRGAVQGVGFRPFIHRLANDLRLAGWINNSAQGVSIEVEGLRTTLQQFLLRLQIEKPPRGFIQSLEVSWLDTVGYAAFEIRPSDTSGAKTALVLPDIATCPDCLRDVFEPANRRYRYPFTNCTNCGPRFTIIERLPYDRANTSMKGFAMCPACQAEYDDPLDRRFHAQPNACPACGPRLQLWGETGKLLLADDAALLAAADAIRAGRIVALKGLGGFHLMVAAHDENAVRRLRERKHREEKPLALMFPEIESVRAVCEISPLEERRLCAPEAPIVLLRRRDASGRSGQPPAICACVAPGNPYLGVMLPYTPLHHLLASDLRFPVVATSGNLTDEPICIDSHEARERLHGIADIFLVHNRPIVRHVDDSVVRVLLNRELVSRRARGYAPLPIELKGAESEMSCTLAVGAHLKNAIALSSGNQVFLSQHIGDLETEQAHNAFRRVVSDFQDLFDTRPTIIAADLHPDYASTKFARDIIARAPLPLCHAGIPARNSGPKLPEVGARFVGVQHHVAHVLSCMAENQIDPPALGVAWDGTGYGPDGTIWGGEFFLVVEETVQRFAHLRPFLIPGGDKGAKEPRRAALGLLYEICGETIFERKELAPVASFSASEIPPLKTMLERRVNSSITTSAGRLFDAVASLTNLRQRVAFEGQAAMELEFALGRMEITEAYPLLITCQSAQPSPTHSTGDASPVTHPARFIADWSPMIRAILDDVQQGIDVSIISARFHNALVEAIVTLAKRSSEERIVLSGGCFQNRYLTERAVKRLHAEGFRPYWHQRVPPNDGGIALGQVIAASRKKG